MLAPPKEHYRRKTSEEQLRIKISNPLWTRLIAIYQTTVERAELTNRSFHFSPSLYRLTPAVHGRIILIPPPKDPLWARKNPQYCNLMVQMEKFKGYFKFDYRHSKIEKQDPNLIVDHVWIYHDIILGPDCPPLLHHSLYGGVTTQNNPNRPCPLAICALRATLISYLFISSLPPSLSDLLSSPIIPLFLGWMEWHFPPPTALWQ